jgi:putative transposase
MNIYWQGAHTKHRLMVHIVWLPKYRKRILKGALAARLKELIQECADVNRWQVDELNVQPDHVHLIIQFKPDIAISKMVQLMKGKSSKVIRQEFPELREFYWGDSFWADGFFAETVGTCNVETIKNYVKNQ